MMKKYFYENIFYHDIVKIKKIILCVMKYFHENILWHSWWRVSCVMMINISRNIFIMSSWHESKWIFIFIITNMMMWIECDATKLRMEFWYFIQMTRASDGIDSLLSKSQCACDDQEVHVRAKATLRAHELRLWNAMGHPCTQTKSVHCKRCISIVLIIKNNKEKTKSKTKKQKKLNNENKP